MTDYASGNDGDVTNDNAPPLRLRACDDADLEVLSTLLQDAILPGSDMQYDASAKRFVMVVNRFCWERDPLSGVVSETGGPVFERSLCGIQFHHVTKVQQTAMPLDRKAALFNILTIGLDRAAKTREGVCIDIVFSGGSALRLQVGSLDVVAEDIEMARPAVIQPHHDDSTGDPTGKGGSE